MKGNENAIVKKTDEIEIMKLTNDFSKELEKLERAMQLTTEAKNIASKIKGNYSATKILKIFNIL